MRFLETHFDDYIQSTNLNEVGNIDNSSKILNLTGNNEQNQNYVSRFVNK